MLHQPRNHSQPQKTAPKTENLSSHELSRLSITRISSGSLPGPISLPTPYLTSIGELTRLVTTMLLMSHVSCQLNSRIHPCHPVESLSIRCRHRHNPHRYHKYSL